MCTHQEYIERVAELALSQLPANEREQCQAHLTYGAGKRGLRGVTYYGAWQNGSDEPIPFVEICAFGEENPIQLAGTTIHELGHVLAGFGAGHGKGWKQACEKLGLHGCKAVGNHYTLDQFEPSLREKIERLTSPTDGMPIGARENGAANGSKPCPMGIGTKGGKSRGKGSGSRLRKWVCECPKPVIVRVSSDDFKAHCDHCNQAFKQAE